MEQERQVRPGLAAWGGAKKMGLWSQRKCHVMGEGKGMASHAIEKTTDGKSIAVDLGDSACGAAEAGGNITSTTNMWQ